MLLKEVSELEINRSASVPIRSNFVARELRVSAFAVKQALAALEGAALWPAQAEAKVCNVSPFSGRRYGLAAVFRVWRLAARAFTATTSPQCLPCCSGGRGQSERCRKQTWRPRSASCSPATPVNRRRAPQGRTRSRHVGANMSTRRMLQKLSGRLRAVKRPHGRTASASGRDHLL